MIGTTISHYKILQKIGEGGMGIVYKAHDTKLDRLVALKFLPHYLTTDSVEKERFYHEARAASALMHPNVTVIYEIAEHDGQLYIAMELVEGQTLRNLVMAIHESPLQMKKILDIAIQVCDGLVAAHEKGIVHRDIKSENIMVTPKGQAKIMDFGLAKVKGATKLTKEGSTLGTAAYMSPEQARGEEVDQRSDIFSFGVVLYELLAGKLPFRGEHHAALMYSIVNEEPQPIARFNEKVTPEIEHIVAKALEKDRDERYQHIDDLLADLRKERKKLEYAKAGYISTAVPMPANTKSNWKRIGSTVLVLGILISIGIYFFISKSKPIDSMAVLPFVNGGADSTSEYLSDGFTESLINILSKLPGVKMMSSSSVFRFKGKDIDPQKAGKDLGVGAVLTGRLTQHGDALMISVELVDVNDNSHLWGNQYHRKPSDILAIQSDISQEISNQLKITLTRDQQRALVEHPTENADAYKLYLQGLFYWNKRTKEGFEKAIEYYQQAISKDASYALAYAGLASVYAVQGSYFIIPMKESIEKARAMALKALQFDERLAEAHTVLAALNENEWKWEDAEREYKRAIDLNPNYATAHQWYGEFLCAMRRFDEGNAHQQRAIEIDPLSPITFLAAAYDLMAQKRYDEATKMVVKSMELDPAFPRSIALRGQISFLTGKPQEALKDLRAVIALSDSSNEYVAYLGNVLGLIGNRAEATTLLRTLLERQQSRYIDPSLIACVYIGLGEKNQAFQWLDKAYEVRSNPLEFLLIDPLYDPIRSDPRFAVLVKKTGLPQ